jgi:hypothetical protein
MFRAKISNKKMQNQLFGGLLLLPHAVNFARRLIWTRPAATASLQNIRTY